MDLTLLTDPADRDWRDRANCLQVDPDDMQPEVATPEDVELARRVCAFCPVRVECKALADGQYEAYGIHAGEWYGEAPRLPERECEHCGELFAVQRSTARFCSANHRQAARRAGQRTSA